MGWEISARAASSIDHPRRKWKKSPMSENKDGSVDVKGWVFRFLCGERAGEEFRELRCTEDKCVYSGCIDNSLFHPYTVPKSGVVLFSFPEVPSPRALL